MASPIGLAIFKVSRDRAEICSYGEWQVPWDLPFTRLTKWQVPLDLPSLKCLETGLKYAVMGSGKSDWTCFLLDWQNGKSHWTCHFQSVSRQAELVSYGEWQVPWDLPFSRFKKWQVPLDLPFSKCLETGLKYAVMGSGKSHGTCLLLDWQNGKSHWTCRL